MGSPGAAFHAGCVSQASARSMDVSVWHPLTIVVALCERSDDRQGGWLAAIRSATEMPDFSSISSRTCVIADSAMIPLAAWMMVSTAGRGLALAPNPEIEQ